MHKLEAGLGSFKPEIRNTLWKSFPEFHQGRKEVISHIKALKCQGFRICFILFLETEHQLFYSCICIIDKGWLYQMSIEPVEKISFQPFDLLPVGKADKTNGIIIPKLIEPAHEFEGINIIVGKRHHNILF